METETLRCQSAVLSLEAQVAPVSQLRGMIDVERQKTNILQAKVLRVGARNPQLFHLVDRSKERDWSDCKLPPMKFGMILGPKSVRETTDISQGLEWMYMEVTQPGIDCPVVEEWALMTPL